jgi:hypothetical protein
VSTDITPADSNKETHADWYILSICCYTCTGFAFGLNKLRQPMSNWPQELARPPSDVVRALNSGNLTISDIDSAWKKILQDSITMNSTYDTTQPQRLSSSPVQPVELSSSAIVALVTWLQPADSHCGLLTPLQFDWLLRQLDASIPLTLPHRALWRKVKGLWDQVKKCPLDRRTRLLTTGKLCNAWFPQQINKV